MVGWTESTNFNTTAGSYKPTRPPLDTSREAFVTKVNASGTSLGYSTYLGEAGSDQAWAVTVDAAGTTYVAGHTSSSNFPTVNPVAAYGGGTDAFVTRLNAAGNGLLFSTHLGGSGTDVGRGVSVDAAGNIYTAGYTTSTDFPGGGTFQGGTFDGFVAKISPLPPPPTINDVDPDNGLVDGDRITSATALTLSGTAVADSLVGITRHGVGVIGTVTASPSGTWTFAVPTLPQGVHTFTATNTVSGVTSASSAPFQVTVDTTPPAVQLYAPATTFDRTPEVRVAATDNFGLPNGSTADGYLVELYVDLNTDLMQPFNGTLWSTATLVNGGATFPVVPPLPVQTLRMQARVRDLAGNQGSSSPVKTVTVTTVPVDQRWNLTGRQLSWDPSEGMGLEQTGNAQVVHALDLDRSPGTAAGRNPYLVYNSETVSVQPVIQATLQTDDAGPVPTSVDVKLWWQTSTTNPPTAEWTGLSTAGLYAGDLLTVATQVPVGLATATGRYLWTVQTTLHFDGQPDLTRTVSGPAFVVAQNASPFGAGWSFSLTDQLYELPAQQYPSELMLPDEPAGVLRAYGTGSWRFYTKTGASSYSSPASDPGALTGNAMTGFTYTSLDGQRWLFNGPGLQTSWASSDTFETIGFGYTDPLNPTRLTTVTTIDGVPSAFAYDPTSGRLQSITAVGSRVTAFENTNGDVTRITDAENNQRNFVYDGTSHRLTNEDFDTFHQVWAYTNNAVTSGTVGTGADATTTTVAPAALQGLGPTGPVVVPGPVQGKVTDGLQHETRWTLDERGRPLEQVSADGGLWTWARPDATTALVASMIDPLGRITGYQYQHPGSPYLLTRVDLPGGVDNRRYDYANFNSDGITRFRTTKFTNERNYDTFYQYDPKGHLTVETDALTRNTVYTYFPETDPSNRRGLLETVTDRRLNVTRYDYDTNRRQTTLAEADNDSLVRRTTTTSYDPLVGHMLAVTTGQASDPSYRHEATTTFTYDKLNRLRVMVEQISDTETRTTTIDYNPTSTVLTVTDALGRLTSYAYDSADRRTQVDEAANTPERRTTRTRYDAAGNLSQLMDPLGRIMLYQYDALNRTVQTTEAWGSPVERTSRTMYDLVGNMVSSIDPLGRRTDYGYDPRDRRTSMTEAVGVPAGQRTTQTAYDPASNVQSVAWPRDYDLDAAGQPVSNPLRITTRYTYDELNRQTQMVEAFGTAEARATDTAYDPEGNVIEVTTGQALVNPKVATTKYVYDALNRRTETTAAFNQPEATTATVVYDAASNVRSQTTGQSSNPAYSKVVTTAFGYDKLNRRTAVTEADNDPMLRRTTTTLYDKVGNVLQVTDPMTHQTASAYDGLNRQVAMTLSAHLAVGAPERRTTRTMYDALNQTVAVTDPLLQTMRYAYDELNRQTWAIDGRGYGTQTIYDPVGNTLALIDPVGNRTSYVPDALNRAVKEVNALDATRGTSQSFTFDASNNPTKSVDRNNRERQFVYDLLDRRTQEKWMQGTTVLRTIASTYDAANNMILTTDPDSTYTTQFDLLRRLTSVSNAGTLGVAAVVLTRGYNAADERTSLSATRGGLADFGNAYGFDTLGRVTVITQTSQPGGSAVADKRVTMGYNSLDQMTSVSRYRDLAGTLLVASSAYGYDPGDRLRTLTHTPAVSSPRPYTLSYDASDRITQLDLFDGSNSYGYDRANQLTSATYGGYQPNEGYGYDGNGNRTNAGYATGLNNELQNDGVYTYTYDNEGNWLTRSKTGEITTYEWDYRNRLTRVYVQATVGGAIAKDFSYKYDVFDRRISKTVDDDGGGPNPAVTTRFVYDGAHIAFEFDGATTLTHRYLHGPMVDQILADEHVSGGSGPVYWALTDHQRTVRDLVDSSGVVQKHFYYDGFGNRTDTTPGTIIDHIFAYTGRELDEETGLYYYRARYYDPSVGRFLILDPVKFAAGDSNLYRYVGNNPGNFSRSLWTGKIHHRRESRDDHS